MNVLKYTIALISVLLLFQCENPDDYQLQGEIPEAPEFSLEPLNDETNRFVVTDLSVGNINRLWEFGADARPKTSTLVSDTVQYPKLGSYTIKLHVAAEDGSGTNVSEKSIVVDMDADLGCEGDFLLFTNECAIGCWSFDTNPGAVKVGPSPLSGEWFTSGNLEPTQLDDVWCFNGEDFTIDYQNNGSSFSACQGYIEDPNFPVAPIAENIFEYLPGEGVQGKDRLSLLNEISFFGVEDSGTTYDIVEINETHMTIVSPLKPCDGAPSTGFFTLAFKKI